MTDMRRTLLWVVFSMSLVLIWDAWNRHNGQPSLFGPPPARPAASAPPAAATGTAALPAPTAGTTGAATAPGAVPAGTAAPAVAVQPVTVTTDVVKATLDPTGGTLVHLELLGYHDQNDRTKNVTLFDRSAQRMYVAETGLIPPAGGTTLPNHQTPMTLLPGETTLKEGSNTLEVKFESPEVGGVQLVKTYTFRRGDYVVGVRHEVVNRSGSAINPQLYLQLVRDGNPPPGESKLYFTFTGPAVYTDEAKFQKVEFSAIEKREAGDKQGHATSADNGWVAMVQHYFASAWLVDGGSGAKVPREFYSGKLDMPNPTTGQNARVYRMGMFLPVGEVAPGSSKAFESQLFAGPQEENKLAALAPGLELVKDYGWFTILAKPLFWLLTQLHKLIGNWGWAIVALVVVLKVAFYWLNASAYRSMAKMKAINPKVMEMRERLKDKPQQMQQEMMRIYREEKVNPLGGCLPIFVQMPFFIALYWVLLSSVEMRNAPWIGWIHDLSAIDPYYILPLLMTGTSLLQTWLNPTPPDPVQAKMMWIMPLMFSVMFFFFPAGLVLYWLTNNILSIAQQYLINKQLGVLGK
ncbi:MAG: membrane protein insertase YidC [Piscinibacter sp.]|uniref:membrane protein insertase YidC n=1 Tax=Piscinibacter sp. TaxID=1903157 RepID=UPI00258DA4DD|nr:membrane protein insertase YidC [Piscinibacter sp.]MCW5665039.1 membrane protein insertase YidC [Piscinibacter sp.]